MTFWVYILRCADGRFYAGQTDDLDRRIAEHRAGGFCDFTARRQPVEPVWSEAFGTRIEALETEQRIKRWSRAKKEALIAGDWARLHQLAVSRGARASTTLSTNGGRPDQNAPTPPASGRGVE
jgi:predicted GIY-YIG superfamily endonuclease